MYKAACSWSGGKDACYALQQSLKDGYEITVLVNMMNENNRISRSHGLPRFLLQQQADALGVPLITVPSSWAEYEGKFLEILTEIKSRYSVSNMVFGDLDLDEHRQWEEKVCAMAGIQALLPLWKRNRIELVNEMIATGLRAQIVSCNENMGPDFLGKELSQELVQELLSMEIDPCGENGEFHTIVTNSPLFRQPVSLPSSTIIKQENYWFLQWTFSRVWSQESGVGSPLTS